MSSERAENAASSTPVRLDKWLWAARIFKTRAIAAEAVAGGKVHLNGARVKPAHPVREGDTLTIQRGTEELTIRVQALATNRGPAPIAMTLYEETPESRAQRTERAAQRAAASTHSPRPDTRPPKKQRRTLSRFRHEKGFWLFRLQCG